MIRTICRAAAAALALTVALAGGAAAQTASPITFNVHAGGALPMGDFDNRVNTGFNLGFGLSMRPAMLPVGLRFDGDYNRFGNAIGTASTNIWALTANAELASAASPIYLLGGLGFYSSSNSAGGDSNTELGFNAGGGFNLPLTGFSTFVEARYHSVSNDGGSRTTFIPITFGVKF